MRVNKTAAAEQHKRRILDVVNQLNEDELEKVSELLRNSDALQSNADSASKASEACDDQKTAGDAEAEENENEGEDGATVEDYDEVGDLQVRVNTPDQPSAAGSRATSISKQSVVSSLKRQLQEEQEARKRLENEMRDLKVVSHEI